jgi:hypothetical protein
MRFAAFAFATLLASAASASTLEVVKVGDGCSGSTVGVDAATGVGKVGYGEIACFSFTDADSTTSGATVRVQAPTALVCFDPDTAATTTSTARVKIRRCLDGVKPSSNPSNECIDMGAALTGEDELDGTEGSPDVQNACIRVSFGTYYAEVTAACESGDFCRVTFEGEGQPR